MSNALKAFIFYSSLASFVSFEFQFQVILLCFLFPLTFRSVVFCEQSFGEAYDFGSYENGVLTIPLKCGKPFVYHLGSVHEQDKSLCEGCVHLLHLNCDCRFSWFTSSLISERRCRYRENNGGQHWKQYGRCTPSCWIRHDQFGNQFIRSGKYSRKVSNARESFGRNIVDWEFGQHSIVFCGNWKITSKHFLFVPDVHVWGCKSRRWNSRGKRFLRSHRCRMKTKRENMLKWISRAIKFSFKSISV